MSAYKIFIKERLPVVPNAILAAGLMLSAVTVAQESLRISPLIFGAAALFVFVSELRFMDELKDADKDKIANPDRPLPRGAIAHSQVFKLMAGSGAALGLFVLASLAFYNPTASGLFGLAAAWLFLMYKEFFMGAWLAARPLLYAVSHQIVIAPLCMFAVALFSTQAALENSSLAFGLLILTAFFSFEVGRKLDPAAHPILKTYLSVYGPKKVIVMVALLQALALAAGWALGALWWIAPPAVLILLTLPQLLSKPEEFKKLEGLISLNLIYIVWVMAFKGMVEAL